VNAADYTYDFETGEKVTVNLGTDKGNDNPAFYVLAPSTSGQTYVTLIYDGIMASDTMTFDDVATDGSHDTLTSDFEKASIRSKLSTETTAWTTPNLVRLLKIEDLTNIGITANSSGIYEITAAYSWLSAVKLNVDGVTITPDMYNYWTMSPDTSDTTKTAVYCVTYNETRETADGIWSTLVSKDLGDGITNSPKCALRPVIVIDKQYVTPCNPKIQTTTVTATSPNTGENSYLVPLGIMLTITIISIIVLRRKVIFKKL
jgi:hypothetical protein